MTQDELTRRAEELLTRAGLGAPEGSISMPEMGRICQAFTAGHSIAEIAAGLDRPEATIKDTLETFAPTMDAARMHLEASALQAAERWAEIARTSRNHQAAKDLLLHTGTIAPVEDVRNRVNVAVIIGGPLQPPTE